MTTPVWSIDKMLGRDRIDAGQTDVVVTVYWSCSATDQGQTASLKGSMGFNTVGDPFVPYASLTQDDVLNWIYERGLNKDQTEAVVLYDLNELLNPPVVQKPLPWSA
jgi:hypothetical protein